MSDAKPVENKIEAATKVVDAAVSLSSPMPDTSAVPAAIAGAKTGWSMLRNRKRLMYVAAGAALGIGIGVYEFKLFKADPGKAAAQSDPTTVAQAKPDEPAKPSTSTSDRFVPTLDIESPPVKVPLPDASPTKPASAITIDVPDINAPVTRKPDADAPIITPPDLPKPPMPGIDEPPVIIIPTKPGVKETKPGKSDTDTFRAPGELPTTVSERKEKKDDAPVIRIGNSDPTPPPPPPGSSKKDDLLTLPDEIKIPATPSTPKKEKDDLPKIPDEIKIPTPPSVGPKKEKDELPMISAPSIGPAPMPMKMGDPPTIPTIDPLPMRPPTIDVKVPGISDPPPPPSTLTPNKKDSYDEDWHAQREGDTYAMISQEYLKDTKYASALEAYNRDRRKPGERIIRVPPTWVLEEQFGNLIGAKPENKPEAKTTSNPRFEAAPPKPGDRLAPPTAAVGNNEYRVNVEAGETIREIARKIYGNANQWKKVWELNPDLDPTQPIPQGTTLRLEK